MNFDVSWTSACNKKDRQIQKLTSVLFSGSSEIYNGQGNCENQMAVEQVLRKP